MADLRVLHAHSGNQYGGVERQLAALARHDPGSPRVDAFLLCFEGRNASELRALGAHVDTAGPVRLRWPWTVRRARRALRDLLRRDPPDSVVCHSHWGLTVFGPAARSVGVPLILWLHGAPTGTHWLERVGVRTRPVAVFCNSRFVEEGVQRLYPDLPTAMVYPPVMPPDPRAADGRDELRTSLGIAADDTVILQVGRVEHGKGHLVFLKALAELSADPVAWRGWQVGGAVGRSDERYLARVKRTAERLGLTGKVTFLGPRSDTASLYAAADVYCQPNVLPESFGQTFVEALHAGLPVVTTAIGGALEICDTTCGTLLPEPSPIAVAEALRALAADQARMAMARTAGPARARALCDPARQVSAIRAALADLSTTGRPRK